MSKKPNPEARRRQRARKRARNAHLSLEILAIFTAINIWIDKNTLSDDAKKLIACDKVRGNRSKLITLSGSQNHRCCYCGRETWHPDIFDYGKSNRSYQTRATLEHLLPDSQGGTYRLENLVMACGECNGARGDLPLEAFMESIYAPPPKPSNRAKKAVLKKSKDQRIKEVKSARNRFRLFMIASWMFPEDYEYHMNNVNPRMNKTVMKGNNKPETNRKHHMRMIRRRVQENRMVA